MSRDRVVVLNEAVFGHRLFMVGDKPVDMVIGRRIGGTPLLLLTAYGAETAQSLNPSIGRYAGPVGTVELILRQDGREGFPSCPISRKDCS